MALSMQFFYRCPILSASKRLLSADWPQVGFVEMMDSQHRFRPTSELPASRPEVGSGDGW